MRIAHIVCSYPPYYGGMGNVVFQTVNELSKLGHELAVYTPQYYRPGEIKGGGEMPERVHEAELQSQVDYARRLTPSLSYGNAARMPDLKKELDNFDLVHLHYPFFGTANLVRKWKLKNPHKPLVVTYHMDTRAPGWKGLIFKYYSKYWMPKILGTADLLIASSFDYLEASDARSFYHENKEKWVELPFGVDIDRFALREKPKDLLAGLNFDAQKPTIVFVGGMDSAHYFKGVPVLLKALTMLKGQGLEVQTVLVGDGNLRSDFENKAKFYGVDNLVRFVGRVGDEDLPSYYNLADLFVLPSTTKGEAFGMVLLEAMASGVPVIASDLPGVRSVARDGGLVVAPSDHKELAAAMVGFFADTQDVEIRKVAVRRMVESKYSWQPIVKKLNDLYLNLVKK